MISNPDGGFGIRVAVVRDLVVLVKAVILAAMESFDIVSALIVDRLQPLASNLPQGLLSGGTGPWSISEGCTPLTDTAPQGRGVAKS